MSNVEILELEETKCNEDAISSMFPKKDGEIEYPEDDEDETEWFKYEEKLPIALNCIYEFI